jgi:hypothetical protein
LIDIFVGRHPEDLRFLALKYQQQQQNSLSGKSIASAIYTLTSSAELQFALKVCSEVTRPDPSQAVDQALVYRDVNDIIKLLDTTFPSHQELFNILLRRNDPHIQQIALFFQMNTNSQLDEAIRKNAILSKMTKKIAVHAVRTATNMTYRDVMLLRDAMGEDTILGGSKNEKLGIRVCRMHWFKQHWLQIKAEFLGLVGKQLMDKMNSKEGMFRDLMICMAMV